MIDLDAILTGAETAAIAGHVRPDGDAFGSCMGLYLFLKEYYPQISTSVYLEDSYAESFRFIDCSDEIQHAPSGENAVDVFFSLDCADFERLGKAGPLFNAARTTVVIDHHISNNGFGMINEIQPDASSTSEIIALLIGRDRINKTIAQPLYMGIIHDTGIFRYTCTSSRTMMVGGWLMDTGIPFTEICDETFSRKTYHQNQVLGRALTESIRMLDGRVIFSVMHRKDMKFYQVKPQDLDGIVQQLRVTEGVEVAMFLYESDVRQYKVSMRSNGKVDVSKIAVFFQGGGHKMAAGCTMNGGVHDVVNNIVARIEEQLTEQNV